MRDLKFRAWNKRLQTMEYITDLYWFEENMVHENGDNDFIIMQSTGTYDSDEKEIYEGDFVVYLEGEKPLEPAVIMWNVDSFTPIFPNGTMQLPLWPYASHMRIVGHTYES